MENKSLQAGQGARLPPGCLRASACPTLPTSFHAFSPPQPSRFSPPIPRSGSGVALPIDTTDVNAPNFLPPSPQTHLPHLSCQDGGNTSSDPLCPPLAWDLTPSVSCILTFLFLWIFPIFTYFASEMQTVHKTMFSFIPHILPVPTVSS